MRINLNVPFSQKDTAKGRGARWDAARRTWYVIDPPDILAFNGWLPKGALAAANRQWEGVMAGDDSRHAKPKMTKAHPRVKPAKLTELSDHSMIDCRCKHVAPWEDCEHTAPPELDDSEAEHMRAIVAGF